MGMIKGAIEQRPTREEGEEVEEEEDRRKKSQCLQREY